MLNQNFPDAPTSNASVFTQLQNAGVGCVWAPSEFTYTHEKAVIIDGTTAWIMTMNLTFSSPTSNREYLALDTDADDVAEADAIFEADFANTTFTPQGKLARRADQRARRNASRSSTPRRRRSTSKPKSSAITQS